MCVVKACPDDHVSFNIKDTAVADGREDSSALGAISIGCVTSNTVGSRAVDWREVARCVDGGELKILGVSIERVPLFRKKGPIEEKRSVRRRGTCETVVFAQEEHCVSL